MAKKAKKRIRQNWCQMVVRVKVPLRDAKNLKIYAVYGAKDLRSLPLSLEILNAYYDLPGQPNARS